MSTVDGHPVIAWLDIGQAALVREVVERAGLSLVGAGSPDGGRTGEVAQSLGCEPVPDLRALLARMTNDAESVAKSPRPLVLFGASGGFGSDPGGVDAQLLTDCHALGVQFLALEPIPASILEAPQARSDGASGAHGPGAESALAELVKFCPLFRASATARDASELLPEFGTPRVLFFESYARPGEGSLGARLYDAMDTVLSFFGEPEQVDAAYVPPIPLGPATLRVAPSETLRDLHGRLTANLRFSDGRAACLLLSDASPRWGRTLTLLADAGAPEQGGRLRVSDDGLEWISGSGSIVESSRTQERRAGGATPTTVGAAQAIADQIAGMLGGRTPTLTPIDPRRVLSLTGAALLSSRTGEGESPATILRMSRQG